jgi:hypothetical protein
VPIVANDILYRLSGGAANSSIAASLGGIMSTTTIIQDNNANNLFPKTTGAQSTAGITRFRGFYVLNNHASLDLENAIIWIDSETVHTGVDVEIGLALEAVNVTMDSITTEIEVPSPAVTFADAATVGAALAIGTIPFGQMKGIWVKQVIDPATAAKTDYAFVIKVRGDTAE